MTNKGYRRITCPCCGTWCFLRPDLWRDGGRPRNPPPDPMEYLKVRGCWCLSSEQLAYIAQASSPTEHAERAKKMREAWEEETAENLKKYPPPHVVIAGELRDAASRSHSDLHEFFVSHGFPIKVLEQFSSILSQHDQRVSRVLLKYGVLKPDQPIRREGEDDEPAF